jgi:hypothetical protein
MSSPRIVKAHLEAVKDLLPVNDDVAATIATAVLTATDDVTRHVVIVREPGDTGLTVYGPYATGDAAWTAVELGHAGALRAQGARVAVFPLVPAPRNPRRPKKKNTDNNGSTHE